MHSASVIAVTLRSELAVGFSDTSAAELATTGLTDGASEHSVGAMTSAEVGDPTASPGAMCDRFNRRPIHRFNRWSLESLQLCQEANDYFSCCE